jgi:ATP-dependent Clp protease ATP-binding subunit ClpB
MDYERLDCPSREALSLAQSLAVRRGHAEVGPVHLLLALVRPAEGLASFLLEALGARPEELRSALESQLERAPADYSRATRLSSDLEAMLAAAEREADARGSGAIAPRHLLAGLLETGGPARDMLRARKVTRDAIFEAASPAKRRAPSAVPKSSPLRDLTAEAAMGKFGPILGRDEITARLVEILLRRSHHPVLLGEKGAGKSAVVEALAETLAGSEAPSVLRGARLFEVEPSLVEEGMERSIQKWRAGRSRVLLHVEDSRVLAQAIRAMRASGTLPDVTWIGCATPEDYYGSLSRQPYLEGCLETVLVEPLSIPTTRLVLHGMRQRLELRHDVRLTDDALEAAADLAARFLQGTKLPGAAIDLLEESAASRREELERPPEELARTEARVLALQAQRERSARTDAEIAELRTAAGWLRARWEQEREAYERLRLLRRQLQEHDDEALHRRLREAEEALPDGDAKLTHGDVTSDDVARIVEKRSGARLGGLLLDARTKLVRLEKNLGDDVLGQREAVRAVASALMRASVKLGVSSGPGGSFLFVGPPGVGKTETARSLARHFLHDDTALAIVRSDDARGVLGALARSSRAVVLVRDVDRASSEVVRLLTRVLEEGVARDPHGRTVDLRQALLVMCSRQPRVSWLSARVEAVVEFGSLSRDIVRLLVDRQCRELSERLAERRVELEWTHPAMEWLAERGWNREEGLHRLHRVLADDVGADLGRMLVLGELAAGSHARVDVQEGRLEVSLVEELTDDTHFAAAAHPLGVVVRQHRREKFAKIDSVRTE